jgi:hypothetical protein
MHDYKRDRDLRCQLIELQLQLVESLQILESHMEECDSPKHWEHRAVFLSGIAQLQEQLSKLNAED